MVQAKKEAERREREDLRRKEQVPLPHLNTKP
jgi:hypothetical protein